MINENNLKSASLPFSAAAAGRFNQKPMLDDGHFTISDK